MSNDIRHTFESADGKKVTLTFRRSLLSQEKFRQLAARYAPDDDTPAAVLHFCWLAAHVVEAKNAPGLPLRINADADEFWMVYESTLALFDEYEGFAAAVDAIPVNQLPVEDDPVKKPLEDLTPEQREEVEQAKLLEANGDPVPEKN